MLLKETKKLFYGKYKHKIVLVTPLAHLFRYNSIRNVKFYLDKLFKELDSNEVTIGFRNVPSKDIHYTKQLLSKIELLEDEYSIRIESPWLSVYSNNHNDLMSLALINEHNVKYFYSPSIDLEEGQVVMSNMPFEFKITMGAGSDNLKSFVDWTDGNLNFKIPESSKKTMLKNVRWRQSYFYVKDEKNLLLAKIHIGRSIHKVEKIINKSADQSEKV